MSYNALSRIVFLKHGTVARLLIFTFLFQAFLSFFKRKYFLCLVKYDSIQLFSMI